MDRLTVLQGEVSERLRELPDGSVHCCVTSPPYWGLRDYGVAGQIGLERTVEEYIARLVEVFGEVRRVLRADGTLWVNVGDVYNAYNGGAGPSSALSQGAQTTERPQLATGFGLRSRTAKPKDLCLVPSRLAIALQEDGWWVRSDIIWSKPNPMPESVKDRPTKSHEYIFLLAKSEDYYYDAAAIAEPATCDRMRGPALHGDLISTNGNGGLSRRPISETRNKRTVWTVCTESYREAHFATYPAELIRPCILAGCPVNGVVLDPFAGSGTTGKVALELGRRAILIELNPAYVELIRHRCRTTLGLALA